MGLRASSDELIRMLWGKKATTAAVQTVPQFFAMGMIAGILCRADQGLTAAVINLLFLKIGELFIIAPG